ncbi:MAG: ATP-binding protein [Bacilli bacterium]|nr:ATP-binding protein [Bacilli bacterium]
MFDKITYISDDSCTVKLREDEEITINLMNLHLIFEDNTKKILAEVDDLDGKSLKARFLGEIVGDKLIGGTIRKPSMDAKIRVIDKTEIPLITGNDTDGYMKLGVSPFYDEYPVYLDVNSFFSNHFAIFGNTGSGKSCGTARLFQNMFHDQRLNPYKANIFIFDSSGEYYSAFNNINSINPKYNYRYISTNETDGIGEKLRLPIYLLNKDDLALLLQCTSHSQLPIIERMLKLALVFSQNDLEADSYKNYLIAKAIMTILYTNETAPNKRNEIFSILASCSTKQFNLEAPVQGVGYVRKFRECFLIDNSGNFTESVLLTEYVNSFIKDEYEDYEPKTGVFYDLDTLEKALNFTLISEGWLRNEQTYGDSVTLKVRLHDLIIGENAKYFDVKEYMSLDKYLSSLLIKDGNKYQIVNINLNDIDDEFAKVLTKIYSRLIFDFSKSLKKRGSIPFHIVLEEAHRYIQNDRDRFLFGYNIFERIAKEGRKYGVILGIITQRPVELSDNVISQCTNFLIFKINHPMDLDYIRKTIPHITDDIIEKQKALQAGTCLGFGLGFRIPLIVKMKMPDPSPLSGNCDVVKIWKDIVSETPTPKVEPITTPVVPSEPIMQPVNDVVVEIPKVPVVNTEPEVEEKFDDSFIVREVPDTEPGAIGEIADVQINSQGMSEVETSPTLVIEDYDDDVDDFEDE